MVRNTHAHAGASFTTSHGMDPGHPTDGSAPVNAGAQSGADESRLLTHGRPHLRARLDAVAFCGTGGLSVSTTRRSPCSLGSRKRRVVSGRPVRALLENAFGPLRSWRNRPGRPGAWCGLAGAGAVRGGVLWGRRTLGWWCAAGAGGGRDGSRAPARRDVGCARWAGRDRRQVEDGACWPSCSVCATGRDRPGRNRAGVPPGPPGVRRTGSTFSCDRNGSAGLRPRQGSSSAGCDRGSDASPRLAPPK